MRIGLVRQLSLFDDIPTVPLMPETFKLQTKKGCGYTKTQPRNWSEEEIEWMLQKRQEGYSISNIAESLGRSEISISVKLKRLGKKNGKKYNEDHVVDKYKSNAIFMDMIKPTSVLDLYAGNSWYKKTEGVKITTNDIDDSKSTDYHEKAEMLIHKLYYEGRKYDLIDLDPFGSAFECFDLAVKMAKKGLVITYGEMGHKRFKRLDFVRRYYGIETLDEFVIERMIAETIKIGMRNKKRLTPLIIKNWNRISRVYYKIEKIKILEQWIKE